MKLVTCFPITKIQISEIQSALPDWQVQATDQESITEAIFGCDVFCGHAKQNQIDWEQVVQAGRLRWIQSSAAGLDHCLVPSVIASEITVSSCAGLFRDSVAEQTMAFLYGLLRSMPVFFDAKSKREYIRRPTGDLHGKTVGIVGFGGNGQRIAQLLQPLGNRIVATELLVDEWLASGELPLVDELLPAEQLDALLSESDIVILTLPLDASTHKMMGEREFASMRQGSWFVNVGRGKLVDEPALLNALNSGHLAGAGIDVAYDEPLAMESPLWDEPNLMITPHVGAQAANRYELVINLLMENARRFAKADRLKNQVEKKTGLTLPADRI